MKFTRIHWFFIMIVTLLASLLFFLIAHSDEGRNLFYVFFILCLFYALFACFRLFTCKDHHRLDEIEDEELYKTSCSGCGEPLAGHECYCPNCGAFLPKRTSFQEKEDQGEE